MTDFVDIIGGLTNFVQNERVSAHNEGVDEMLDAIRSWMLFEGVRITGAEAAPNESVPELLNEIKEHFQSPQESASD
jgi:hypothetical protein